MSLCRKCEPGLSVENIEISPYAQARQSLLLLTQGNIYNRLRFLNKYLLFLEELNELFRENWSKFLTFPGCRVSRHFGLKANELSQKAQNGTRFPQALISSYEIL